MPDDSRETRFHTWLMDFGGIVLKIARAYTRTAEDSQDLVQEILLQLWRSVPQYQGQATASTWCYRVALNTALGWHRKEHRRRQRQQPLAVEPPAASDNAEAVTQHDQVERLYAAIRRLPKADAALALLYLDDLTYRQMADVLGISENHVGVKLNRAKKALSDLLKGDGHEF